MLSSVPISITSTFVDRFWWFFAQRVEMGAYQCSWKDFSLTSTWSPKTRWRVPRGWWSSSWSNSASEQARDLIFFKPQVFGYGESFGTIFRGPRLTWRSRTAYTGCRRSRTSSWSNSAFKQARDLIFFKPQVFGYGQSFGTIFVSLRSTWRWRTGWRDWTVGGQGGLQEVKF